MSLLQKGANNALHWQLICVPPHHLLWLTPTNSSQSDSLQENPRILVKQTDWCYKLVDIDSIIEKINTFYYIMNVNFVYIIDSNCNKF